MGNAFFVVWRESLEAFLIAGILYAWLQANDTTGKGKRALFIGLAVPVPASPCCSAGRCSACRTN